MRHPLPVPALPLLLAFALVPSLAAAQPGPPAGPPVPAAPPPGAQEADAHFRRGVELYGETDYRAALIEFRRAYELLPSYRVLFDIASCAFELQDYAGALVTFQRYLDDGGADVPAQRRAEVERQIDRLRPRVARVDLTTEAGAEVQVDDVTVGRAPLAGPLLVSAGRRRITAALPGRPPVSRVLDVAGADLVRLALVVPEAPREDRRPVRVVTARPVPVLPWVATGLLAAGTAATGALALSASSDLKTKLATYGEPSADIKTASNKTAALALSTDLLGGATVLMAGISIYLTASRGSTELAPAARSGLLPTLRIGAGIGSIQASGTF